MRENGSSILLVIVLIGLVVLGSSGYFLFNRGKNQQPEMVSSLDDFARITAVDNGIFEIKLYYAEHGLYPGSLDTLDVLQPFKRPPFEYKVNNGEFSYCVALTNKSSYCGNEAKVNKLLDDSVKSTVADIALALDYYHKDTGSCPSSLSKLVEGNDPYIKFVRNNPHTGQGYLYEIVEKDCVLKGRLSDGSEVVREIPSM